MPTLSEEIRDTARKMKEIIKNREDSKSASLAVIPDHKPLMRFYGVDNYHDLVDEQERHIQRLQRKLPPLKEPTMPGNPRQG